MKRVGVHGQIRSRSLSKEIESAFCKRRGENGRPQAGGCPRRVWVGVGCNQRLMRAAIRSDPQVFFQFVRACLRRRTACPLAPLLFYCVGLPYDVRLLCEGQRGVRMDVFAGRSLQYGVLAAAEWMRRFTRNCSPYWEAVLDFNGCSYSKFHTS